VKLSYTKKRILTWIAVIAIALPVAAFCAQAASTCVRYEHDKVTGSGPLPYNYRVIDGHIHAGGHPLGPVSDLKNPDKQVMSILKYLKSRGVVTVIDLQDDKSAEARYVSMLNKVGIKRLHVPLSWLKVPSQAQWTKIEEALNQPVYIHCKWGADRTGLVIAKYLIQNKGYTVKDALDAVSDNGSHSGAIRGINVEYRYDPVFLKFLEQKGG
jgi:protein-tyrosine phosphatase